VTRLRRLTERVWYLPHERERDRPALGYVRGDRWSLAVDAGHSDTHVRDFYRALEGEGLPLPALTAITHWHWDHAFGMHAVCGFTVASERTAAHLSDARDRLRREGPEAFLALDESVRREYAGGRAMAVALPDVVFSGDLLLSAGNCPVHILQAPSPHTDDSTLVHVPDEGVLFFGDAKSGTFPTWEKDAALCLALSDTVESTGADTCVGGHWEPMTAAELVAGLRADGNEAPDNEL
jgi:glyoxylase-like metal-dependent hydrolase (beta-lactamase superfamily II)